MIEMTPPELDELAALGRQLRVDAVRATAAAGSGHPTSAMSAADLMAVLLARYLRYDFERPATPSNDHLIFSKGHATPLLYALWKAAGAISDEELLTYRKHGSRLEGHPTTRVPWVDVGTGSLGLGLPVGVGVALSGERLEYLPYRVWVLCGDSELAEGSIWEAFAAASHHRLGNLVAVVDVNRLGQSGETMVGWDTAIYAARARAFGWAAIEIDGHDIAAIDDAYAEAVSTRDRPTAIFARTLKGKGVAAVEDRNGFHGKPLADPAAAVRELGGRRDRIVRPRPPLPSRPARIFRPGRRRAVGWCVGEPVATRRAYGEALAGCVGTHPRVLAMDGEVSNSTYSGLFREVYPERYIEAYVAEQAMIATAIGLARRGWVPFVSTFAAFFARAYDFIRMAAISRADLRLVGSHVGVSVGEDGPSQMALEDIAMFRALPSGTVLYPCCANQTLRLVELMREREGIVYLRATRMDTPVLYDAGERFAIGGSRTLRRSASDDVTVVAAGVTVHEALAAADAAGRDGIAVRVVNAYSVAPLDAATIADAARETGRVVVAEDHSIHGGLGAAVLEALADSGVHADIRRLGVRDVPSSGSPRALLAWAEIDREAIRREIASLCDGFDGAASRELLAGAS